MKLRNYLFFFILITFFSSFLSTSSAVTIDPVTLSTPSSNDITSSSVVLTWDETTTSAASFGCYHILRSTRAGFTDVSSIVGSPFFIPTLSTAGTIVFILLFMFFAFRKLTVLSCIMLVSSIMFFSQAFVSAQVEDPWMSDCISSDKTVLTYTDSGLDASTTYYYKVYVLENGFVYGGNYAASNEVSVTTLAVIPTAPTNVSATGEDGQVTITWDNVSGATSYNIYWSTSSGVSTSTGTKITGATSPYTHTSLNDLTTYYHIMCAENSGGESTASSEVNAAVTNSASRGKAASTAVASMMGSSSSTTANSGSNTVSAPSFRTATISKGIAQRVLEIHKSRTQTPAPNSVTYDGSYTITFTNEVISSGSGGTVTVNGSIGLAISTSGNTSTITFPNSSLTFDIDNVSDAVTVDGNTYNLTLNGALVFGLSGNMLITGSYITSLNMVFSVSSNSLSISGDVGAIFPSGSMSVTVGLYSYSCSGTVNYEITTGETGSCSFASNCESCY